jgi:hypothetical protein
MHIERVVQRKLIFNIRKIFNKLNDLEFKLEYCSLFGGKNESYHLNSEIIDNVEDENNSIRCCDELADSCVVTSAELNEKPTIVGQRSDDTNQIQQAHTNSEDSIEHESTARTNPINLELRFACLDTSEYVVTCPTIEENRGQVITELDDHSQLSIVHEQEKIDTVKSTVKDIKNVTRTKKKIIINRKMLWINRFYLFFFSEKITRRI